MSDELQPLIDHGDDCGCAECLELRYPLDDTELYDEREEENYVPWWEE